MENMRETFDSNGNQMKAKSQYMSEIKKPQIDVPGQSSYSSPFDLPRNL